MRKTSIVLLCIALSTILILPVSAKKEGGQAPTIVVLEEDILYTGPAKVHDTRRSFSVSIGEEGKNQPRYDITFSEGWPPPFGGNTFESYKTFISIYINKDGSDFVRLSVGHESDEGHWVIKGKGTYNIDSEGKMHINIYEVTDLGGNPIPSPPLYFTLTY